MDYKIIVAPRFIWGIKAKALLKTLTPPNPSRATRWVAREGLGICAFNFIFSVILNPTPKGVGYEGNQSSTPKISGNLTPNRSHNATISS